MHAATAVVMVDLPRAEVFDYLVNPEHLAMWIGDMPAAGTARLEGDSRTGVIDLWLRPDERSAWGGLPVRVMNLTAHRCVVLVTGFAAEGEREALLAWRVGALQRQLEALPERVDREVRRS